MAKPPRKKGRYHKFRHEWSQEHNRIAVANGRESWAAWCEEIEREKAESEKQGRGHRIGNLICGAKRKSDDTPCRNAPLENGRCRYHGGKSLPGGASNPNYEHGRYSEYLPKGWRDAYERNRAHRDALGSLYDLLALGEAQIGEILQGLVDDVLKKIRRASTKMHRYHGHNDEVFHEAWEELDLIIEEGATHIDARQELTKASDHVRKLADTIGRTERDQIQKLGVDELETLELFVVDVIRRATVEMIDDHSLRTRLIMKIAGDLDAAARATPRRELPPGDGNGKRVGREIVVEEK